MWACHFNRSFVQRIGCLASNQAMWVRFLQDRPLISKNMKQNLLITIGCSWTYGIGSGYKNGMTRKEYKSVMHDPDTCYNNSFRGMLCNKYNMHNKNFSVGGSSNQTQFRLAKNYFTSDQYQQDLDQYNKIIVLWGITSTARNEAYFNDSKQRKSYFYTNNYTIAKVTATEHYSHDDEVQQLALEIKFWNMFFKREELDHLWFDTFNHHDYAASVTDHFLFGDQSPRDLLSQLAINNGWQSKNDSYHRSEWAVDSERSQLLSEIKVINPYSLHPTQSGQEQISKMFESYIDSVQ